MLTHFLTSQPALTKLDNENIGGHLTPLQPDGEKKFENLLRTDKVIAMSVVYYFLGTQYKYQMFLALLK